MRPCFIRLMTAVLVTAALSGCAGEENITETDVTVPETDATDIKPAANTPPEILTVGEVRFSIYDDTADVKAVLGDMMSMDFSEDSSHLTNCLDIDIGVFYSPNYNGDPSAFVMYNGLTGASGAEEIEAVLGDSCIKVTDEEGVHFLEVFADRKEIDYSAYAGAEGNFDEVFTDIMESTEPVSDSMMFFCFNCYPDGTVDHIVDLYKDWE